MIPVGLVLSLIVVLIVLFAGWKGWGMVYRHHVGVADAPDEMLEVGNVGKDRSREELRWSRKFDAVLRKGWWQSGVFIPSRQVLLE